MDEAEGDRQTAIDRHDQWLYAQRSMIVPHKLKRENRPQTMDKIKALWTKYFSSINALIRAGLGAGIVLLFVFYYITLDTRGVLSFFQRLELQAYDARLLSTMPEKIDPRVVIIDIDEKSIAAEGRWPWGRDKVSALVKQAFENYKVKVIGFDVFFTEADTSSGLANLELLGKTAFRASTEFQESSPNCVHHWISMRSLRRP